MTIHVAGCSTGSTPVYWTVWRFNVDYTKVSDTSYFNDFDNKYGSSTDGYATQKFSVGYAVQNFDATVSTKQFRVFDAQTVTATLRSRS